MREKGLEQVRHVKFEKGDNNTSVVTYSDDINLPAFKTISDEHGKILKIIKYETDKTKIISCKETEFDEKGLKKKVTKYSMKDDLDYKPSEEKYENGVRLEETIYHYNAQNELKDYTTTHYKNGMRYTATNYFPWGEKESVTQYGENKKETYIARNSKEGNLIYERIYNENYFVTIWYENCRGRIIESRMWVITNAGEDIRIYEQFKNTTDGRIRDVTIRTNTEKDTNYCIDIKYDTRNGIIRVGIRDTFDSNNDEFAFTEKADEEGINIAEITGDKGRFYKVFEAILKKAEGKIPKEVLDKVFAIELPEKAVPKLLTEGEKLAFQKKVSEMSSNLNMESEKKIPNR